MGLFEALAFVIASREYGDKLPSGIAQYLAPLEAEARSMLAVHSPSLANFERKVARIPRGFNLLPAQVDSEILDAIYDGLLREKVLALDYRLEKGIEFSPVGLVFRDQVTYLVGTFWNYKDLRQLAVHRITSCNVTDVSFSLPKDFNLQQYEESGAFGYARSDDTIILEMKMKIAAARHLRETPISQDQDISEALSGWVTVRASVHDRKDLIWWILGFGDQVEVVSPAETRDRVRTIIDSTIKNYK
jgi:predicted DNA-binding transcriptional regulator YafY